jgi:hypothetical protein
MSTYALHIAVFGVVTPCCRIPTFWRNMSPSSTRLRNRLGYISRLQEINIVAPLPVHHFYLAGQGSIISHWSEWPDALACLFNSIGSSHYTPQHWRCKYYILLKCRYPHTRLHDIMSQKTTWTITAVKTSKLLSPIHCHLWYTLTFDTI